MTSVNTPLIIAYYNIYTCMVYGSKNNEYSKKLIYKSFRNLEKEDTVINSRR